MINVPTYFPGLLAAAVVLLLLWLAWRRPNRQRLVWRLLASAVAGVSLVLLVFPPATQQAISPGTAILLTKGYDSDTLAALLQGLEAKPQVYTYKTAPADDAVSLSSLQNLRQQQPGLQTLHLLGYGLDEDELHQLVNIRLQPHLSATPAGAQGVQWPQSVHFGEAVEVAGKYTSGKQAQAKLYLYAAGKAQDSVALQPDSTLAFRLRYTPKQAGRFTYTLLAKTGDQADTLGQVPVQVKPAQQLAILMLASAPNFEFRFLKNHLAALQHKVALRTTVSKAITQTEWLNMPKTELTRIAPKLLKYFDVVVTEPEALENLSTTERTALQKAVSEDGLGVLTITTAPANSRSTAFFTAFQSRRLSQQDTRNARASWSGNTTATATAAPYALINTTAVNNLVEEQGNVLLAGAKRAGWGKVAMSFVPQTFPWQLEGKDELYSSYWANLLAGVAKEQVQEKFWMVAQPQVPQPDQPMELVYTDYTSEAKSGTPNATITSLSDSVSINLPLAQNIHQLEKYNGTFWPRSGGWYQVQTPDAEPYYFYVHDAVDWSFATIQARQQATLEYMAKQSTSPSESIVAYKEEPVSLVWFFLLFALSSAFLWLEEKF
ncbi:hypothetical protein ACSX1A_16275 [Pontibacter sp. MBLB2868]|uniref:hypothetical protein n=1 Tax=Pontibacter sp. MBLB2868 TaxID=3451555 RepID=UPI003F74D5C4